ncbi:aldose 1-epimerase [soil metagenome]
MVTLSAGTDEVVIDVDRGARIISLIAGGTERVVGPTPEASASETTWGCFLMAPWVGRIARAEITWEGETYWLRPNLEPHAIHGVVFDEAWTIQESGKDSLTCTRDLDPRRWPFGGRVRQRFALTAGSLVLEATVQAGPRSMPASLGWHPWWRRAVEGDMRVTVNTDSVLETLPDLIPTGGTVTVADDTDLRDGPELGARRLDHVYTVVRPPALVTWPDLELQIDFATPLETVVVYTPPEGVCVEPQTAWPNAPALAPGAGGRTGLVSLGPGESLAARTSWTWSPR